jgi:hypothetical protein
MINKTGQDPEWFNNINIEAGKKGLYDFSSGMDKEAQVKPKKYYTKEQLLDTIGLSDNPGFGDPHGAWEVEKVIPDNLLKDPDIYPRRKKMWEYSFYGDPKKTEQYFEFIDDIDFNHLYTDPQAIEAITYDIEMDEEDTWYEGMSRSQVEDFILNKYGKVAEAVLKSPKVIQILSKYPEQLTLDDSPDSPYDMGKLDQGGPIHPSEMLRPQ